MPATLTNPTSEAVVIADHQGSITYANEAAERLFGYRSGELSGVNLLLLFPEIDRALYDAILRAGDVGIADAGAVHTRALRRDGSRFLAEASTFSSLTKQGRSVAAIVRDMDAGASTRSEELLRGQRQLLENIAAGVGGDDALVRIAEFVEQQCPGVKCALFGMEEGGQRLRLAAAPTLSADSIAVLSSLPVGPAQAASGTAAYRREIVLVEDIATDTLFDKYRVPLSAAGVRACWAAPIFSPAGAVLGTLAMYFAHPQRPDAHHSRIFDFATGIAAIVIEKFQATQELQESEERSRALVQHSSDAVLLVDAHGTIQYSSPAAPRLFGVPETDLVGSSALSFVHPDQRQWLASTFRAATGRSDVTTQALRVERKDGAVGWLEVTISNQLDHPVLKSMILNYRDITDRVEALDRLWQQQEQYRAIVEAVTDAIMILDLSGRIVTANKAACDLHGYELDDLVGMRAADLLRPDDRSKIEAFAVAAAAGEPFYAEMVGLRQDGSEASLVMHGTSFLMGGIPHLLSVSSNVSEQKRMQQRLERADRISSLGRLAATIAHEMNNVMMGIVPFTEIIKRRTVNDPVLQNATTHILKSTERGKNVTQDILRFTRATGTPELASLAASDLLDGVAEELRLRLNRSIRLEVFAEEGLLLLGDAAQLQQVVVNLIMNAAEAMPNGGPVRVRAVTCSEQAFAHFGGGPDAFGTYAHLCVSDDGHGIAPYLLSHIFEPLFTTKGSGGTGLGLAIVHQIVIAHEGQIHVESERGRGTTFHLLLRKAEPAVAVSAADAGDDVWTRIRSVLLVEDELSVGEGLAESLRMEGVTCDWVTRGKAALERLKSDPPDLLILDVGLPDMSGVDVYRSVARTYPHLPTIFSTGHGDHRLLDEFDPSAPVAFLSKPYGMELLKRRVQSLLNRPGLSSTA